MAPPKPLGRLPAEHAVTCRFTAVILPGSLDNTVRFSCLLSRSGDPWRGPSNWGLGTKDTQAHTHIYPVRLLVLVVVRTDESPLRL